MKVYTKTGDKGSTGLVSGSRVKKSDQRIDLYGNIDHLNSFVGFLASSVSDKNFLQKIQCELFNLGSLLACEAKKRSNFNLPQMSESIIKEMEIKMDLMTEELPSLKNFILPGGSEPSARAHLCRTLTRNAERSLVAFSESFPGEAPEHSLIFLNRLSDYFFVLGRYLNFKLNQKEVIWNS